LDRSSENAWALESGKSTGEHDLYLFRAPQMRWLMDTMYPHIYEFWKRMDYRRGVEIIPTSGWANLHKHNQTTGEHSHCGGAIKAHVSVVYYLKKPANSGNIEFVDPLEYIHKMSPKHVYDETLGSMYSEVEADQFDLVIFPSWLKHRTQPNLSNEDRVAISVNFIGLW
jgi:uncharacterized protein (TIGR02466 family)